MTDYFSTDPVKASPGQQLKICYDFTASGGSGPINVKLDFDPPSVTDSIITLSAASPCITITVPAGADGLLLIDQSEVSEDHLVSIG